MATLTGIETERARGPLARDLICGRAIFLHSLPKWQVLSGAPISTNAQKVIFRHRAN
jgi:hypothetical protein